MYSREIERELAPPPSKAQCAQELFQQFKYVYDKLIDMPSGEMTFEDVKKFVWIGYSYTKSSLAYLQDEEDKSKDIFQKALVSNYRELVEADIAKWDGAWEGIVEPEKLHQTGAFFALAKTIHQKRKEGLGSGKRLKVENQSIRMYNRMIHVLEGYRQLNNAVLVPQDLPELKIA